MPERPVANPVGIDKGIRHRMTLSDGTRIPARTVDLKTIIKKQRILSRAVKAHQDREKAAGKRLPHSNTRKKKQQAFAKVWRRETDRARNADFRLVMCRDRNAARNISVRGMETLGSGGTASRRSRAIQVLDVRPGSLPGEQGGPDTAEQYRTAAA